MANIVVSSTADADTADIISYLATKAGRNTAIKYNGFFEDLFDRLADYPECGARRPVLGEDVRIGIVMPFIVIYEYRKIDNTVTILRIVHGRRKVSIKMLTD